METKVIRIEIKLTRPTLALLLGLVMLVVALGVAGAALAQPPDPGAGLSPDPEAGGAGQMEAMDNLAASGVVSPAISYQGRLTDNSGNPLDGTYDMEFQFWNAESGGSQVGNTITLENVDIDQGLFNVSLEVNPDDFNGRELWLTVRVREHGGTWDGWMTPRQQIQPVPYALSLRPGAIISDTLSYVELNRFTSIYGIPIKYGVYAKSEGMFGYYYGVYGRSENGYGVFGSSDSGAAVFGYGDVKQSRTGNGLVKAAVYAYCTNSATLAQIHRSFNNVNTSEIAIANGSSVGRCTIDFGFDVSDRFWVATAPVLIPRTVGCFVGSSDTELDCSRFTDSGASANGDIMVLVY